MKKVFMILLAGWMSIIFVSCAKNVEETPESDVLPDIAEPELMQMQEICDIAVMECYYHNVTKYHLDDAEKFLWFTKDMDFWIEYDAVATLGVDGEKLHMEVSKNRVRIELPQAELLKCDIVSKSDDANYYMSQDSAEVNAEHEIEAYKTAQDELKDEIRKNTDLMQSARNRVKTVLEEYIMNFGEQVGVDYIIEWAD